VSEWNQGQGGAPQLAQRRLRSRQQPGGSAAVPTVVQSTDGTWRVERSNGEIIAEGLSHARAWAIWDEYDREATRMEETRRRVSIATGQW
jgi:hypothetical protein